MTELSPQDFVNIEMIRRAFRSSDRAGEAALNGLLYASGALVMSAVLLATTTNAVLGAGMAAVPWLILAAGAWWWIGPAMRNELALRRERRRRLERAQDVAADLVLLDQEIPSEERMLAARYLTGSLDSEQRERAADRLLELEPPSVA
jgi:hypothetical protein